MPANIDVRKFKKGILKWYSKHGRTFPWREKGRSSYEKIVTEILLQRTQAKTVSAIYEDFFSKFPDWQCLANSDLANIENALRPIGLWQQRSVRLKNLAEVIVEKNSVLPRKRKEIDHLPNVGQYVGNAIELLVYSRPLPLLDINMARVLERYFGPRVLVDIRYDPYLQELSRLVVKGQRPADINFAILDFAALVCKARKPDCCNCPISKNCLSKEKLGS